MSGLQDPAIIPGWATSRPDFYALFDGFVILELNNNNLRRV
jgi:hypothetical protein